MRRSLCSITFFYFFVKERSVLCVFFAFIFLLKDRSILFILFGFISHTKIKNLAKKEFKRMQCSFYRLKKNLTFFFHYIFFRVERFIIIFRFYHMGMFHEWDLLVLRPFVTKKIRAHPTECTRGKLFIFKKSQGP